MISRNWDKSPETEKDTRFHDLRASGWRGPIDQDTRRQRHTMNDEYWNRYGDCPEFRCMARSGEPCIDLRRWPIHYEDHQWRHPVDFQ